MPGSPAVIGVGVGAQHRHQKMGAVLPGCFDRILPHIVVFRVGLAAGDRTVGQADSGQHIAHLEPQRVVGLFPAGVVFLHGDVPLFLHVPDELPLVLPLDSSTKPVKTPVRVRISGPSPAARASSSQICTSSPEMSQPSSVRRPVFGEG